MSELRKKTTQAVFWSALDIFIRFGVQLGVVIALSRILTPEEYAIMAMLTVFTAIGDAFIDGGFSSALIQRQNPTATDESTVFFFNLGMAVLVSIALCISAPWIARLLNHAIMQNLTYVMAINLFINALGSIHTALLTKELNFKTISKIGAFSSILSGSLGISAAMHGFGVWSLALQTLSATTVSVLLLWAWHPWKPLAKFSFASLRSMFRFGSYLFLTSILEALHSNLYSILIGKLFTTRDVGFYDRAQKTYLLPVHLMMTMINRVAYSSFSAVADNTQTLAYGLRKAQQLVMFVNIPLMIAIALLAHPIVLMLFGEKWLPSAPILQVLGLAGILWPANMLNLIVLKAQGRSDLYLNTALIKKAIAIVLTIYASFYGIMAIAWAQVAATIISFIINAYYTKVFLNYGLIKQLRDLLSIFAATIPAGLSMYLILLDFDLPAHIELMLALMVSASLYLLTARLFHISALTEIIGLELKTKSS